MSRTAATWRGTEHENRNAFTVQLHSLLTQVKSFTSYAAKNNNSLPSLQKNKVEELGSVTDGWLDAIGDVQKLKSPLTHAGPLNKTTITKSISSESLSSSIVNPSFSASPSPIREHDNHSIAPYSSLVLLSQSRCTNGITDTHEETHDGVVVVVMDVGNEMSNKQNNESSVKYAKHDEVDHVHASHEVSQEHTNKFLEEQKKEKTLEEKEVHNVEKENNKEKEENQNKSGTETTAIASTSKDARNDEISNAKESKMETQQVHNESINNSKSEQSSKTFSTVEVEVESVIGNKTLAELVQLLTLLRSNDLPDARKFKALALALTRLLMVRCEIVLKSALRRIVVYTLKSPVVETEEQQESHYHEHKREVLQENISNWNSKSFTLGRASPFIASARDIRNSCQALSRCVTEMAVNENWADAMAVRFAVKFAADVLQIMRKSILYVEFNLLHIMFANNKYTGESKKALATQKNVHITESIEKDKEKARKEEKEELNNMKVACKNIILDMEMMHSKVVELKTQWGPFVCNALLQFSPVMDVCINVLVRAAGLVIVSSSSPSTSSPTRIVASTNTAVNSNNYSVTAIQNQNVYNTNLSATKANMEPMEVVKRSAQEELRWLSEEVIRGVHFRRINQKEEQQQNEEKEEKLQESEEREKESKSVQESNLKLAGLGVLLELQISWTLEVCVALSHYSGDDSDGKKLTAQLMYNIFVHWSTLLCKNNNNSTNTSSEESTSNNVQIVHQEQEVERSISVILQVHALLEHFHWRKPVLSGLLTCILSSDQTIRFCGLTTLSILTTFAALSQEITPLCTNLHSSCTSDIGYLYKKCLFKLLSPSSNCSLNVKKEVLWHVICNFTSTLTPLPQLQMSSHSSTSQTAHNSMLLFFYNEYDLQINWHELNLMEEMVQLLSSIVRQGSRDDFAWMQSTSTAASNNSNSVLNNVDSSSSSSNKNKQKMKIERAIMRQLQQELPNDPGSPVFMKSILNNNYNNNKSNTPFVSNTLSLEETWLSNPLLNLPLASSMALLTHISSSHSISLPSSSSSSSSVSVSLSSPSRYKPPFVLQQEWLDSFSLPSLALYGLTSLAEVLCTELPRFTTQTNDDKDKNKTNDMLHDVLLEELRNTLHLKLHERKNAEQTRAELFNDNPEKAIIRLFHLTHDDLHPDGCDDFIAHRYDHHYLPFALTESSREDNSILEYEQKEKEQKEENKLETQDVDVNLNNNTTRSVAVSSEFNNSFSLTNSSSRHKIKSIVLFFRNVSALSPDAIAEYLTLPSCFPLQVCAAYMASLPLAGKSLPEALRELLTTLPLPREGQRIERLLEYFSAAYYSANANTLGPFTPSVYKWDNLSECPNTQERDDNTSKSRYKKENCYINKEIDRQIFPFTEDTFCFVATVATVMLNTDQHNPHAGAKMNLKSFISQMKSSVNSIYFTNGYAEDIFYHISHHFLGKPRIATENSNMNENTKLGEQLSMSSSMPVSQSLSHSSSTQTPISKNSAVRINVQDNYHGINALFISNEERQQLAFAMERQQLMNTTREYIVHQYSTNTINNGNNANYDINGGSSTKNDNIITSTFTSCFANPLYGLRHHLSLLRDVLWVNWFTLLSVFNVGVQGSMPRKVNQPSLSSPPSTLQNVTHHYQLEEKQQENNKLDSVFMLNINSEAVLPEGVLLPCIRGLQCLFYLAAALDLPTESSEALVALVRLLSMNRSFNNRNNYIISQRKENKEDKNSVGRITRCVLTAIFNVAASPFAIHLSTYCWNHIFTLMLPFSTPWTITENNKNIQRRSTNQKEDLYEEEELNQGVLSHELEVLCTSLFTRIEHITRESCEARRVMTDDALYLNQTRTKAEEKEEDKTKCTSIMEEKKVEKQVKEEEINELHYRTVRIASASVNAMLNAMMELLEDVSIRHHSNRFTQLLHLLHRILTYTCIKRSSSLAESGVCNNKDTSNSINVANNCMNEEVRVVTYVNVKDFYYLLLPQLMALLDRCSSKDETCLSSILNCIVELLSVMWKSYTTEFSIVSNNLCEANKHEQEEELTESDKYVAKDAKSREVQSKRIITRDDVPEEVTACFNVFERILAHTHYNVSDNKRFVSDSNHEDNDVYYTNAERHAELLRRYILQTIKELIARSLHTFTSFAAQWHNMTYLPDHNQWSSNDNSNCNVKNICVPKMTQGWSIGAKHGLVSLHTLYEMWRRLLNPLMTMMIATRDEYRDDSYTLSQLTLHQLVLIATGLQGNQNNSSHKNDNFMIVSNNSQVNALFTLYYTRLLSAADKQRNEADEFYDTNSNENKKMISSSNVLCKVKRDVCEYCGFVFRHMSNQLITLLLAQVACAGTLFASCSNQNNAITRTKQNTQNNFSERRLMKLINTNAITLDMESAMSCLNELTHLCSAILSQLDLSSYATTNEQLKEQSKLKESDMYMETSNTECKESSSSVHQVEKKEIQEPEKSVVERDVVFALCTSIHTQSHSAKYVLQLLFALLLVESNEVRMNVMERIRVLLTKCPQVELLLFVIGHLSMLLRSAAKDVNTQLEQRYRETSNNTKKKKNSVNNNEFVETTSTSPSPSSSLMCNCACITTEWNRVLLLELPLSFSIKAEIGSLQLASSRDFLLSLLSAALRLLSHDVCFIASQNNNKNNNSSNNETISPNLHTSSENAESMSRLISHIQLNTRLFISFIMECGAPLSLLLLINKQGASLTTEMKRTMKESNDKNTTDNNLTEEIEQLEQENEEKEVETNQLIRESLQMATEVVKNMMQAIGEYNKRINEVINRFVQFIPKNYNNIDNNNDTEIDEEIEYQVQRYNNVIATVKDVYRSTIMSSMTAILWRLGNLLGDAASAINKENTPLTDYDSQMYKYISTLLQHKETKEKKRKENSNDTIESKETNNHYTLHTNIQELPSDTINAYCTLINYVSLTLPSVCATMKRVTTELEKCNILIKKSEPLQKDVNAKRSLQLYKLPTVNDDVVLIYLTKHINILLSVYGVYDEEHWNVESEHVTFTERNAIHVPIKHLCNVYFDLALSDTNAWPVHDMINMFVKIIAVTRSLQTRLAGEAEKMNITKEKDVGQQEDHFTRTAIPNNVSNTQKYMDAVYVDLCATLEMWIQKSIKLEPTVVLDDVTRKCNINKEEEIQESDDNATRDVNDQKETTSQSTSSNKMYEFQQMLGSSAVFNELITLLTPHAGSVISAIRDYLSWYIDRGEQSSERNLSEHLINILKK